MFFVNPVPWVLTFFHIISHIDYVVDGTSIYCFNKHWNSGKTSIQIITSTLLKLDNTTIRISMADLASENVSKPRSSFSLT